MKRFLVLASLLLTHVAWAGDLDFVLKNETGRDFEGLYISSTTDKDWNGNLLSDGVVLKPGASMKVEFPGGEDSATWDINVVDADGLAVAFEKVNLIDVKQIKLKDVDGKITAVVE